MMSATGFRQLILVMISAILLAACNTTARMEVKPTTKRAAPAPVAAGQSRASFVLAGIVSGVPRGEPIFAFPAENRTEGYLCNLGSRGDDVVTYSGGRKLLGDWSSDLGVMFYEELSRQGLKIAGDPSELFHQSRRARSADYQIAGRLISISGNFCHIHHWWDGAPLREYSGEMSVEIEWSVLSNLTQEVVLKDRTTGYFKQNKPIRRGIPLTFENAMANAIGSFGANPDLRTLAVGQPVRQQAVARNTNTGLRLRNGKSQGRFDALFQVNGVVTVRAGGGHGSGFFVGHQGHVLTNAHVVGSASQAQIITNQGLEVTADVIATDPVRDVAVLKSPLRVSQPMTLNRRRPAIAETVYAIGTPVDESLSATVTRGIVSAIRRDPTNNQHYIQADAAISPGNSGGPLLNGRGEVVGISVAKVATVGAVALNLFVPIDEGLDRLGIQLR